jgi:hypothetical protein
MSNGKEKGGSATGALLEAGTRLIRASMNGRSEKGH